MPISISDIKWGSYKDFEGPYYAGRQRFVLQENPTFEEKVVSAITATEGGTYDAVNMYDVCIMTVGIVQWCDKFNLVTRMLGYVAAKGGIELITKPLQQALKLTNATFKQNLVGDYRFFIGTQECNTPEMLRKLYFGGALGTKGSWTDEQKNIAKTWAAGMASIWENQKARELQLSYTAKRIDTFTLSDANRLLMMPNPAWDSWTGAVKAIYVSYAANNPVLANKLIKQAYTEDLLDTVVGTEEWAIKIIKRLALGSNIQIWPGRYDRLRPVIERLYKVTLPKDAIALQNYVFNHVAIKQTTKEETNQEQDTIPAPQKFSAIEELAPELIHDVITEPELELPVRVVDQTEAITNPVEFVYYKKNQNKSTIFGILITFIKFLFAIFCKK